MKKNDFYPFSQRPAGQCLSEPPWLTLEEINEIIPPVGEDLTAHHRFIMGVIA